MLFSLFLLLRLLEIKREMCLVKLCTMDLFVAFQIIDSRFLFYNDSIYVKSVQMI